MWKVTFKVTHESMTYEQIVQSARQAIEGTGYAELMTQHMREGRLLYRTAINLDGAHVVYTLWQTKEDRVSLSESPEAAVFYENLTSAGLTHETTYEDIG